MICDLCDHPAVAMHSQWHVCDRCLDGFRRLEAAAARPMEHKPVAPSRSARLIATRYRSRCSWCGQTVEAGERVFWTQGGGVSHVDCANEAWGMTA
jgi:hypothetical protein